MKSNADLLRLYSEEKSMIIGTKGERTGLEHFPSFKQWKAQYAAEYNETHNTVTIQEADVQFDELVKQADDEFDQLAVDFNLKQDDNDQHGEDDLTQTETLTETGETEMTDVNNTTATEETTATEAPVKTPKAANKPKRKPAAKKPARKPTKGKKVAKKPAAKKNRGKSKAAKAQTVFNRLYPQVLAGKKVRKDVIAQLMNGNVQLSAAGASTYYQNMVKKYRAANA